MKIRAANSDDMAAVVDMLRHMHEEAVDAPSWDEDSVTATVMECIGGGMCFLAMSGDKIAGTVGLGYGRSWWSTEVVLGDHWFYVRPEYRRSRAAWLLLRHVVDLADEKGMRMQMGASHSSRPQAVERLLRRFGFRTFATLMQR